MENEMNIIEKLYDENNEENIILYDENDVATEFEQLALIPYGDFDYAVLLPVTKIDGIEEDEVMIFRIDGEGADAELNLEDDPSAANAVFDIFVELMEEEE